MLQVSLKSLKIASHWEGDKLGKESLILDVFPAWVFPNIG